MDKALRNDFSTEVPLNSNILIHRSMHVYPLNFFFINSSDDQVMGGDAKPSSTSESLGNDESDGNENGKKSNGFRSTK